MANEINVTVSLSYYKSSAMKSPVGRTLSGEFAVQLATKAFIEGNVSIATSSTAIPLGGVTQPYWAYFCNLDATNYLQLRNGASGAIFARLYPGQGGVIPLDAACVPYAIANTAACVLEYLIVNL